MTGPVVPSFARRSSIAALPWCVQSCIARALSPGSVIERAEGYRRAGAHGCAPLLVLLRQVAGRDLAQTAGVVVLDRLEDLLTGAHDEGAVEEHRLADRLAAEHEHVEVRRARVL